MKIKLTSEFKSIKNIADIELPNFVILTGLNGAGKTQLLQAIANKKAVIEVGGDPLANTKMFSGGLGEIASGTFYGSKLERFCIALQNKFSNYMYWKKSQPQSPSSNFESVFTSIEKQILNAIRNNSKNKGDELQYVDRMEIMKHIPTGFVINDEVKGNFKDAFQYDLSQIFKRYQINYELNQFNCYRKDAKGAIGIDALSDEEFLAKHGEPPWNLANEILTSAKLGYLLTTPEGQDQNEPFTAKLIKQESGLEIGFSDLSSGEKVLMSLALALYDSHYDRTYPEALLLDEPDCHLHPSMAGKLIDVLENVFVERRNIPVVMTTHSPSTVALAKEQCVFAMATDNGRISKQTKERCIKLLTAGLPALSIDYDNRLQVFVESKYDARNLGDIYEALKNKFSSDISLTFISSGSGGSGSCDQVREIVSVLRRNGNSKIYGVIDWDGKNAESEFIKIPAYGTRYSLENLILDPLLLGVYLIREAYLKPETAGLSANLTYVRLANMAGGERQALADHVVGSIGKTMSDAALDNRISNLCYMDGSTLLAKTWYLEMNGHDLEAAAKTAFSPLKRYRGENDLKNDVIKKVVSDFPQFVPSAFGDLYRSIQDQHVG